MVWIRYKVQWTPRLFFKERFREKENAVDRRKNGLLTSQSGQRKLLQKLRQLHTTVNCGLNWCNSPLRWRPYDLKNRVMGREEDEDNHIQMEYIVKQQMNFKFTYFLMIFKTFHQFFNV